MIRGSKATPYPCVSLARALSKLGYCSRTQALDLIEAGRVRVSGKVQQDKALRVDLLRDPIEVDGKPIPNPKKIYLMLNKPRGCVTTRSDEKGRKTVYDLFPPGLFPWLAPVGRLDKASEGLLLFTNDTSWAAFITAPESHVDKTYHVQIDRLADPGLLARLARGERTQEGDFLQAKSVEVLRRGRRQSWLKIVLDEGKNRHIRRLLSALGVKVLRLVRVAIGPVNLGNLPKGAYRPLKAKERNALSRGSLQPHRSPPPRLPMAISSSTPPD